MKDYLKNNITWQKTAQEKWYGEKVDLGPVW